MVTFRPSVTLIREKVFLGRMTTKTDKSFISWGFYEVILYMNIDVPIGNFILKNCSKMTLFIKQSSLKIGKSKKKSGNFSKRFKYSFQMIYNP